MPRCGSGARDQKRTEVDALFARIRKIAEGAALMTGTEANVRLQGGSWELLVNHAGEKLLDANLRWIGTPRVHGGRSRLRQEHSARHERAGRRPGQQHSRAG
jgi:metal-dependent amidase/aminoacylase/carboxypeptidase family protein